jgi:mannitol/fructose-specific phosphotransferase system IIA component (Ntr-type)
VVACLGKLLGAGGGARLSGMDRRTSWGVGLAMNARGAMEMILGLLALQYGLIRETMFVALVVMALFTSLISAPALHFLIRRRRMLRLKDVVSNKLFLQELDRTTKREVIQQMCTFAADAVGNAPERLFRLVWEREGESATGWQNGLAVPCARVSGLLRPIVVLGKSHAGVDFEARNGKPPHLVILILTEDNQAQNDLLHDTGELFTRQEATERVLA